MKDFFGQSLKKYDDVAAIVYMDDYGQHVNAVIVGLIEDMIHVDYEMDGIIYSSLVDGDKLVKKPRMISLQTGEVREYEC